MQWWWSGARSSRQAVMMVICSVASTRRRSSHACKRERKRVSGRDLLTRRIGERANYNVSIVSMPFSATVPRGPGCQSVLRSTNADGAKRSVVRHSDKARAAEGSVAQAPRRCRAGRFACAARALASRPSSPSSSRREWGARY